MRPQAANSRLTYLLVQICVMFMFGCSAKHRKQTQLTDKGISNWVCVYSENAAPTEIARFDLAVLDGDAHPDLSNLTTGSTILLGYVSLAEVGEYRWYWPQMRDQPWLLGKNPNWDSHMVDVRERQWHDLLLDHVIPAIIAKGFQGLFLDTIDTAEYLEKYHPDQKHPGSQKAMVKLIKKIRKRFPGIYLAGNRGFSILAQTGAVLDAVMAESIFTTVNFEQNKMYLRPVNQYQSNVDELQRAQQKFDLAVFTLDYVDDHLQAQVGNIISRSRANGFIPFLSTPSLDTIYTYTLEK